MTDKTIPSSDTWSRRSALIGLTSMAASGTAFALTPRTEEHRLLDVSLSTLVPAVVPPWRYGSADGVVVARPDEELPSQEYDQLVARTYTTNTGLPPIMLLVAYGSTQGSTLRLHRPETCYPAQGFAVRDMTDASLEFGPDLDLRARRLTAVRDQRIERMLYWTRIGKSFPTGTLGEYQAILGSVLTGIVPDGVLVRFSTITEDVALADKAIDQFIAALYASTSGPGRQILFGDAIAAESSGAVAIRTE